MDALLNGLKTLRIPLTATAIGLSLISISAFAESKRPTDPESLAKRVGMTAIYDEGMSEVVAQGFQDDVDYLMEVVEQTGPNDQAPEIALMTVLQTAIPFLPAFSGYTISGVEYDDPEAERVIFNADATVTLILPDRIGEIAYRDFKARDSSGAAMGDIVFDEIRLLENSTLKLIGTD
ncbi:hypothetical protein SAMN05421686_104158 [Thalassolituus maritimus]|uniref:Uncharacterized protein n=2 Tax=Thalassolituus maritimus TaxID=484498 RepID=A0A1N7LQN2_9GAMM|nr:hypothetical protein SAMN05421686_104158 [Thalassolituus maritimus]